MRVIVRAEESAIGQPPTGIPTADNFIATARSKGLDVAVQSHTAEPLLNEEGRVVEPACTAYGVTVTIPVPETIRGSLGLSVLTQQERTTTLVVCFSQRHDGRARGRWTSGNYSTLGGHDDMHTLRRCYVYLDIMASAANQMRRFAEAG